MPRTTKHLLTPHGKLLLREHTTYYLYELTPDQFVDEIFLGADDCEGICLHCEAQAMLLGGAFCTKCTKDALVVT